MSCYIYFYLKEKNTPTKDWLLRLAHICTSDARQLVDELENFGNGENYKAYNETNDEMYGYYLPATKELLENTIKCYDSLITELEKTKARYEKELEEAKELYLKATSDIVLEDIKETIADKESLCAWCDEDIERFKSLKSYIKDAVISILEENYDYESKSNTYEVVYYMG